MIEWRKSSRSGGGNDDACAELARLGDSVGVRDTKDPEGDRLELRREQFAGLVARLKRGDLAL